MQAFQALLAHRFMLSSVARNENNTKFNHNPLLDPASAVQMSTFELVEVIKNHRRLCIGPVHIKEFIVRCFVPALILIRKTFAAALRRRSRAEDIIASQYEGRSWGDATEREMINDIANWGCTRFRS